MRRQRNLLEAGGRASAALQETAMEDPVVLAIGDRKTVGNGQSNLPSDAAIKCIDYGELTPELLERVRPDIVMAPLLSDSFDCSDIALMLHRAGFTGRFRVACPALPRPEMVRREIRALCPNADVELIDLSGTSSGPMN